MGSLPGANVVVTDDLGPPLDALVTYVPGSGTLDGAPAGVTYVGSILTADYAATYGNLPTGVTTVVRFRVQINATVPIGTTITNTGVVSWNSPAQTASASVSTIPLGHNQQALGMVGHRLACPRPSEPL